MVEVHVCVGRPENTAQLIASHDLASVFEQIHEDDEAAGSSGRLDGYTALYRNHPQEGLFAELDESAAAAQFHPVRVHFKDTETRIWLVLAGVANVLPPSWGPGAEV